MKKNSDKMVKKQDKTEKIAIDKKSIHILCQANPNVGKLGSAGN